jgi:hypothetical protein
MVPLHIKIRNHVPPPQEEWSIHDGEESIYVLSGTLLPYTEHYAPLTLKPGESCYLDSTMRHAFVSGGEENAESLCTCLSIKPLQMPSSETVNLIGRTVRNGTSGRLLNVGELSSIGSWALFR